MPSIAVSCRSCGCKRSVPDSEICLGIRCQKCYTFMEAERNLDLEDLDWLGRKRVRQLTPLAKMWLLLMLLCSLAGPLVLWTTRLTFDNEPKVFVLVGVVAAAFVVAYIVGIVAMLNLKKWGFFALAGVAVAHAVFVIALGVWPFALAPFALVGVLFAALKAGQPDSWSQLR